MVYALPAGPVWREPSTQLKRGVGDGAREVLGVAPVDAEPDPDPVGGGLSDGPVTKMTEIKFELPERGVCTSFLK
jgi:hypothetical protein